MSNRATGTLDAEAVCSAFEIGSPVGSPAAVQGGLVHRMWRLSTTTGDFAIKQLNPTRADSRARDGYRATERIAAAFTDAGIPAVVARDALTDPLREVESSWLLAYPWVEGAPVALSDVTAGHARWIGAILAQLHRQDLQVAGVRTPGLHSVSAAELRDLAHRSEGHAWGPQLSAILPDLISMSNDYQSAAEQIRNKRQVISHRDLDPKNVLWHGTSAWLIDWEGAARIDPLVEVVSAAIDWSGYAESRSDPAIFKAVIEGYRSVETFDAHAATEVLPVCGVNLRWLSFSIRRALGEAAFSEADRAIGTAESIASLNALAQVPTRRSQWRDWLGG